MAGFLKTFCSVMCANVATLGVLAGGGYLAYVKLIEPQIKGIIQDIGGVIDDLGDLKDKVDEINEKDPELPIEP